LHATVGEAGKILVNVIDQLIAKPAAGGRIEIEWHRRLLDRLEAKKVQNWANFRTGRKETSGPKGQIAIA
jgi:hypothetical protein